MKSYEKENEELKSMTDIDDHAKIYRGVTPGRYGSRRESAGT